MSEQESGSAWVVGGGREPTPGAREFGGLVRYLREQLGMTATELAGQVGISQGFLSAIEHGKQAPSQEYAGKLLAYFRDKGALDVETEPSDGHAEGPPSQRWFGGVRPDFLLTDPRTDEKVVVEVKAKKKGDNQAHFEKFAAYWASSSANRMAPNVPGLAAILVPTAGLGEDALYGSVVRRLAGADRERLTRVARFLDLLDREVDDAAHGRAGADRGPKSDQGPG